MLVNEKTMFDHCYCIKSLCHLETVKTLEKVNFCFTIIAGKNMKAL